MLPIQPVDAPLYVIAPIINPCRYRTRYHHYRNFEKYITDAGGILYTIEAAFGEREFEITDPNNPRHIRVQTEAELWHKENLINMAVQRLPADWKYVAWIDADVSFSRPDIIHETVHQLQHYGVVQMFSQAVDLGPRFQSLNTFDGFVASYFRNNHYPPGQGPSAPASVVDASGKPVKGFDGAVPYYGGYEQPFSTLANNLGYWHSGFAWAARRDAWNAMGGLLDFAVIGSADYYMAYGLIGAMEKALPKRLYKDCATYVEWCLDWQERTMRGLNRNIGYVDGLLLHHFHGSKKKRGYVNRSAILWDNHFNPVSDIRRDWQGLWKLTETKPRLRDDLRAYFRSRDEDSPEL